MRSMTWWLEALQWLSKCRCDWTGTRQGSNEINASTLIHVFWLRTRNRMVGAAKWDDSPSAHHPTKVLSYVTGILDQFPFVCSLWGPNKWMWIEELCCVGVCDWSWVAVMENCVPSHLRSDRFQLIRQSKLLAQGCFIKNKTLDTALDFFFFFCIMRQSAACKSKIVYQTKEQFTNANLKKWLISFFSVLGY